MLTKRQQQALIATHKQGYMWPSYLFKGLLGTATNERYFAYMSAYTIMDAGLAAIDTDPVVGYAGCLIYLTPPGQRLAAILAELPASLTRRQWQILLRFRDVGSGDNLLTRVFWGTDCRAWLLPLKSLTERKWTTTERTMRVLCDYGLIGYQYSHGTQYAHLTPLGEELVSLLP